MWDTDKAIMETIYPKTLFENMKFRAKLIEEAEKDDKVAGAVKAMFNRDILFAFNSFFWLHDTRVATEVFPFITYPFQDETILEINRCIESGEHIFIDKSRDMGATYMVLYTYLWRFLTKKGEQFRIGSRKEEMVDKSGDMGTLFEKLRFNVEKLPKWLLPLGFNSKKHSTYMRIYNPETGSSLMGESTNRDFGAGTRPKSVMLDEFARWEKSEEAWISLSDATPCKIPISTYKGSGNKFAELGRTEEIKNKIHLHWSKHPKKALTSNSYIDDIKAGKVFVRGRQIVWTPDQTNALTGCYVDESGKVRSEWYDNEVNTRTESDVKENLDCNPITSGDVYFDVEKCNLNMLKSKTPDEVGDLHWKIRPMFDTFGNCTNKNSLEVQFVKNGNGKLKVWEHPKGGWSDGYCLSADVAEGLAQGDFNSAPVLRRFPLQTEDISTFLPRVVAEFHGHIKTFEYAEELAKLAVYYGYCWVAPERTGLGLSVVDQLYPLYNKIYHKQVMTKGFPERTDKLGWDTSSQSKPIIMGNLSASISVDKFVSNDAGFWKETLTFVNDDGKLEAQGKSAGEKCYDDKVMAMAILLWIHNELPSPTRKREKAELIGWRKDWNKPNHDRKRLVGFAI